MGIHPAEQLPPSGAEQVQAVASASLVESDNQGIPLRELDADLAAVEQLVQRSDGLFGMGPHAPLLATAVRVPIKGKFVVEKPELPAREDTVPGYVIVLHVPTTLR